jgi:hypothetical protein
MSGGHGFFAGSRIPLNMRGGPWVDQVPRREAFEKAHPEVSISYLNTAWQAVIPEPQGEEIHIRYELADLLDLLEGLFGDDDSP